MYEGHMFGFGGGFMWIVWILIFVAIVWLARSVIGRDVHRSERDKSALEILQERYAKGEINREEYEQKKQDLPG